ncbi:MAG: endonuclease NucS [Verrucomicrobiales bacterium]|nr:endonuclease NucS [Verrucomicrobiales bacterium]
MKHQNINRLEDRIRDFLCENLECLESGLQLFKKEQRLLLEEHMGAGGRVDIVAKDRFGHFVLIEIKRSDQAARQAVHEISKYTALFRARFGLDEEKVRIMVVSTSWHELRLPLTEFKRASRYHVEGKQIEANQTGDVLSVKDVGLDTILPVSGATFSRCQDMCFFTDETKRNLFLPRLHKAVSDIGIKDFVILTCDHLKGRPEVIYPFCLYLAFSSPVPEWEVKDKNEFKGRFEWEDGLDQEDENLICAIYKITDPDWDSHEIGYPEKFVSMRNEWSTDVAIRAGRFGGKEAPLSDEEILRDISFIDGGSSIYHEKITSPKFETEWEKSKSSFISSMEGYSPWQEIAQLILDLIYQESKDAVVSMDSYAPGQLPLSFYELSKNRPNLRHRPGFNILVEGSTECAPRWYVGVLGWDGTLVERPASVIMEEVYSSTFNFVAAMSLGVSYEMELRAIRAHNLEPLVFEWGLEAGRIKGPTLVSYKAGKLHRSTQDHNTRSITEFLEENQDYLSDLRQLLEETCFGL